MPNTDNEPLERQQGPFEDTTTTTYEVAPVKITITKSRKSTHVPPADEECDCGCGGGGIDYASIIPEVLRYATPTPGPTRAPDPVSPTPDRPIEVG